MKGHVKSSLECRREILKLVNYHERKFDNTAFRYALVSVFFILRDEADSFSKTSNDGKIIPERASEQGKASTRSIRWQEIVKLYFMLHSCLYSEITVEKQYFSPSFQTM